MKICTITCHNVNNFGASLQATALCEYLRGLGHDARVIDYMPVRRHRLPTFAAARHPRVAALQTRGPPH